MLVFATPKFCATAQCGPTLDKLKPIAAANPDLTFINVEPYQLEEVDGQLQPVLTNDQLTTAPATDAWRLPSEPWIFVVDGDGIVQGSFALIVGDEELEAAVADRRDPGQLAPRLARVVDPERVQRLPVLAIEDPHRLGRDLVLGEVPGWERRPVLQLPEARTRRARRRRRGGA